MINFDYARPLSVPAAVSTISKDPSAQFIAGGTNLIDLMKRGVANPQKLIDITKLPLNKIEMKASMISIGSMVLNSVVAENELVLKHLPLLSKALQAGASPQIRNMATVGGNMLQRTRCGYFYDTALPCNKREPGSGCSAIGGYNRMHAIFGTSDKCIAVHPSDMCVALVALDAVVQVTGAKGSRQIPFADFHKLAGNNPEKDNNLQKGELITGITLPINKGLTTHTLYSKIRDRTSYAFALVSVAAAVDLQGRRIRDIRLAMGGVAHKPWRLSVAESYLKGKDASITNFQQAANLVLKDAKSFGYNDFKLKMAPNTIVHTLKTLTSI